MEQDDRVVQQSIRHLGKAGRRFPAVVQRRINSALISFFNLLNGLGTDIDVASVKHLKGEDLGSVMHGLDSFQSHLVVRATELKWQTFELMRPDPGNFFVPRLDVT